MRCIQYGDADIIIAGGSECATTPTALAGFSQARALSERNDDPQGASRPWDKDRDGFVMGDGGGAVILEELEHAKARGARIYAEVVGFGMSGDAYHITAPPEDGAGARLAMVERTARRADESCGHPVPQCPRDLDAARRQGRDGGDQERLRRLRLQAAGQLDEVHDRPPAGRGGRGRSDLLASSRSATTSRRRRSTTTRRIRTAISTTCRTRRASLRSTPRCRIPSGSAAPTAR